jgi:hypothetical protein
LNGSVAGHGDQDVLYHVVRGVIRNRVVRRPVVLVDEQERTDVNRRVEGIDLRPARVVLVRVVDERVAIRVVQVESENRDVAYVHRQVRIVGRRRVGIEDDRSVRPFSAADGRDVQTEVRVLLAEDGAGRQTLEVDDVRAFLDRRRRRRWAWTWRRRWARARRRRWARARRWRVVHKWELDEEGAGARDDY